MKSTQRQRAPDFNLLDLDGLPVSSSIMRGKVLILDFWATWCGPCTEEMPTLEKIREEYKSRGVEVWGISAEEPSTVKVWLARHERRLQSLMDPDGKISEQYQVAGIPALVVIGRNGKSSVTTPGINLNNLYVTRLIWL